MAKFTNQSRAKGIEILLDAAKHLRDKNFPRNFNDDRAIKILLECAVKTLGVATYMGYGLRIDRDRDNGHLTLLSESHYHATHDGKLIRLGGR